MKDFINTIFQTSKERLKNPFIGSFILSWCIFNWKAILIIVFSAKTIEQKIDLVSNNYFDINLLLWFPIIMALLYVLVLPYISLIFDKAVLFAKKYRNNEMYNDKIEDVKRKYKLTQEELKYEKIKINYDKIVEQNKTKDDLSEQELLIFKNDYEKFINTSEFEIFKLVAPDIRRFKSVPDNINSVFAIEKLIALDLIDNIDDEDNQRVNYFLTKKGDYYWKNIMLATAVNVEDVKEKEFSLEEKSNLPF